MAELAYTIAGGQRTGDSATIPVVQHIGEIFLCQVIRMNEKIGDARIIPHDLIIGIYLPEQNIIAEPGTPVRTPVRLCNTPRMDTKKALAKIDQVLTATLPDYPFTYRFADEELNQLFETENMISQLATIFAVLAIFISCLGLFGLAAYTAEKRTKEIGIRKVLGATVGSLAALLSSEFLQLVCLACIIAFPMAWWGIHTWLQQYQYRTSID